MLMNSVLYCLAQFRTTVVNTIIHEAAVHSDAEVSLYRRIRILRCSLTHAHRLGLSLLSLRRSADAQEMSVYKLMEKHGMISIAEKDREDHQEVKQAMAELDTHSISAHGLDVFASKVNRACHLFLEHALVRCYRILNSTSLDTDPLCMIQSVDAGGRKSSTSRTVQAA